MKKLKIEITSWAIVSLAGGGLGKVEQGKCQGEKEKNCPSHPQQVDQDILMKILT